MNFGTPVPLLVGIVLIIGAVALFFVDKLKPGYGRDSDKVYAILWLICGVFLLAHLNMEFLASFQQLIMAGMLIAVTIENVLSRVPGKVQSYVEPPGPPMREPPYRPSRAPNYRSPNPRMNVRAELENERPFGDRGAGDRRMLSGRDERGPERPSYYGDDYGDRSYPSRDGYSSERPVERLNPGGDRIRRRRPKSIEGRYDGGPTTDTWEETPSSQYGPNTGGYSSHSPSPQNGGSDADSYADYRPLDDRRNGEASSSDYRGRY